MINMVKKVLISPSSFGKCDNYPIDLLKKNGYEIVDNPYGRKLTSDEVIKLGKDCNGIIAGVELLDINVLKHLPLLQCISRVGVGIDNIDLKYAKDHEIIICKTKNGPTRSVAELTIGLILDVLRKISYRDREIRKGNWNKEIGYLLQGKNVGIIGLGNIGKTVAKMLLSFDVNVSCNDINPDITWAKLNKISILNLNDILKESDIISIHVSSLYNKKLIINKNKINIMKKGSFLINTSRGDIIDENALCTALKNNHLAGAALDVFNQEPYTGCLIGLDNIILTSHIGSYAKEARIDMEIQAVKNFLDNF